MALNYLTRYPGQVIDGGADYPEGQPRNVGTPGDGTGTPWEADLVKDLFGFLQGLTGEAGIAISGIPDTAQLSDRLAALKLLTRRVGCQIAVTGDDVANNQWLTMEIVRQSEDGGFFVMDDEGEEAESDIRLGAPVQSYYYVHFSGLVILPQSGANPATAELRMQAADAAPVYGVRYSAAGLHPIAMSGGGMISFGPTINVDEFNIQNKSNTPITVASGTLTVVRVGSSILGW